MSDDTRAKIEAELKQAEDILKTAEADVESWRAAVEKLRTALDAYGEAMEMKRTRFPRPIEGLPQKRQRVSHDIEAAIEAIPKGQIFTLRDVFARFENKGLDYQKSCPSISLRLTELSKNGEIEKLGRGKFKKPSKERR